MDNKKQLKIIRHASNFVTLVQLMDTKGKICHECAVDNVWVFDTNPKK